METYSILCMYHHLLSHFPIIVHLGYFRFYFWLSFMHAWVASVSLTAIVWTVARQSPLSIGFSRQEYWSGLPSPPPGYLSGPGTKPASLMSPALAGRFFYHKHHLGSSYLKGNKMKNSIFLFIKIKLMVLHFQGRN